MRNTCVCVEMCTLKSQQAQPVIDAIQNWTTVTINSYHNHTYLSICPKRDPAVRSIKKQQLVEVRSMANPPSVVKMALESICTLLGERGDTWKGIRSVVMKENFISTIVNFETENVTLVCKLSCFGSGTVSLRLVYDIHSSLFSRDFKKSSADDS